MTSANHLQVFFFTSLNSYDHLWWNFWVNFMEITRRGLLEYLARSSEAVILKELLPTPTPTPPPMEATATPTPTPTPPASPPEPETPTPSPEAELPPLTRIQIEAMVRGKASQAGLNPDRIARAVVCESTFNPKAVSPNGLYHGLLQYDNRTWREALAEYQRVNHLSNNELEALKLDILNPVDHIEVSIPFIRRVGYSRWPNC